MTRTTTQDVTNELKKELKAITGKDYGGNSNKYVIQEIQRVFAHYKHLRQGIEALHHTEIQEA